MPALKLTKACRWIARALAGGVLGVLLLGRGQAIIPMPVYDTELAQSPIIVIGYWPKSKRIYKEEVVNGITERSEVHTKLVVTRCIQGGLEPGFYDAMYNDFVNWGDNGRGLTSSTSTMLSGDVEDVTKPNIWFLRRARSWDAKDHKRYLHIYFYRCIQDPAFEAYYGALRSKDRNDLIAPFLRSNNPRVVDRALAFVSAKDGPWPIESYESKQERKGYLALRKLDKEPYDNTLMPSHRLTQYLPEIRSVAFGKLSECRPYAAALYAEMAGVKSVPSLRKLVHDQNESVRAIALAHLVQNRATDVLESAEPLCKRLLDVSLSREIILAMERTGDRRYVPCVLSFLDRSHVPKLEMYETGTPFLAREVLQRMTSFVFPLDAERSRRAWERVQSLPVKERSAVLTEILGNWKDPLTVVCRPILTRQGFNRMAPGRDGEVAPLFEFAVINSSGHRLTVPVKPGSFEFDTQESGGSESTDFNPRSKSDFVKLPINGAVTFQLPLDYSFVHSEEKATLRLSYTETGKQFGLQAWMGVVDVRIERGKQRSPAKLAFKNLPPSLQHPAFKFLKGAAPTQVMRARNGFSLNFYLHGEYESTFKQIDAEIKRRGGKLRQKMEDITWWDLGPLTVSLSAGKVTVAGHEEGGSYSVTHSEGLVTASIGLYKYGLLVH